jgi:superoxide reductase
MDRRKFISMAFGGATVGLIAPSLAVAGSTKSAASTSSMAGGVYFTKAQPGRWSKKVGGHLPNIEVVRNGTSSVLKVVTAHEMNAYAHYIVKHIVLDKDFNFIAEHMFDPTKDKAPISEMSVGTYRGLVNVLSVCNKHDTWLNSAEV